MAPRATAVNGSGAIGIQIYGYAGGFDDPTSGLVHFGQRWYDPTTGRWTQQDALETLADPTRANRYEYANSNPINYVDPTGRLSVGGTIAAVAGGAIGGALAAAACVGTAGLGCAVAAAAVGGAIGGGISGGTASVLEGNSASEVRSDTIEGIVYGAAGAVGGVFGGRIASIGR